MKKLYLLFGVVVFLIGWAIVRWSQKAIGFVKDESVLIVGTSADYPPYESIDVKTGEVVGFDIDIVKEMAQRMGKKVQIKDKPFTSLIFALLTSEVDMIAAGMSPTEKRGKLFSFSDFYVQGSPLVIVSKKSKFEPLGIQQLQGRTVAVNLGYIADMYMSKQKGIDLVRLKSPVDCFMALQTDSVDAFVCAQTNIKAMLQRNSHASDYAIAVLEGTNENCTFMIDKENKILLAQVNHALGEMQKDGTLQILKEKWEF